MVRTDYYQEYEKKLKMLLLHFCTSKQWLGKQLLEVEELDAKWEEMAPEYMVNALPEIAKYPHVALAWAGYLGMGLAACWDTKWSMYAENTQLYQQWVAARGFDEMDEYITEDILKIRLDSPAGEALVNKWQAIAQFVLDVIRKEQIEPQSKGAFHIYARSVKLIFKFGVALELYHRGYKYEKAVVG